MSPRTLLCVLRRRAESAVGSEPGLHLRIPGGWRTWSWAEYWRRAQETAAGLRAAGVRRDDHLLVLATEPEPAVRTILGAWLLGAVPTPIGVPYRLDHLAAYLGYLSDCAETVQARFLVRPASLAVGGDGASPAPGLRVLVAEDLRGRVDDAPEPDESQEIALVQLTSGSTGRPRGVVIPHRRLLRHLHAMDTALGVVRPGAVGVSWLPLYHDMGLIGGLLFPLYCGFELRLSSPAAFRSRPWSWLQDLSDFGAAITVGPPSAWGLCVRMAERAQAAGLELSRLQCVLVGAEPISARLLERFAAAFAPCGFRARAFVPAYGLAEATLAVTFPKLMGPRLFDRVDGRSLECGRAEPAAEGSPAGAMFTGLGQPIPGTSLRIVDEDGADLPERRVGEILVASDTLMAGYYRDPEATEAALADGWLRTGDLGYLAHGELFVTGRKKDLIVRAGQKLVPAVVEELAAAVPGIRGGGVAAVGVWSEALATQRALVVAETREPAAEHASIARAVREALRAHGITIDEVRLVPPGTLPKTTSGKLIRHRVPEMAGTSVADEAGAASGMR
jgi:acyl-CoA synthetase (AMP-forming)/AMP-acid ligase II